MNEASTRVSDWIIRAGSPIAAAEFTRGDSTEALSRVTGHFALHLTHEDGSELLIRDPLGVNKLFFAVGSNGVESSNYFIELVRRGYSPEQIWSVPSGHWVRIWPGQRKLTLEKYSKLAFADDVPAVETELPEHAARIKARLTQTFEDLKLALAGRPLYVTLSGGLDSTTVAAMVREHLGDFTAVTFVARDGEGTDEPHSDAYFARRVAREFGVPFEVIQISPGALPELLDEVLLYGQDFRDFNVHCALVNAVLAAAIGRRSHSAAGRPCVLTGDTMNELMSDYTPVQYGASEYYSLPNLSPGRLRRFLVAGLDTGDREVGVFAHHGIDTIQPYALCADAYASLPCGFLDNAGAKQTLARLMMGNAIPSFIYDRPKVRAQVADSNKVGGTMAALLDRGIDGPALFERFRQLYGFDEPGLKRWIRAGLYRFTATYPETG